MPSPTSRATRSGAPGESSNSASSDRRIEQVVPEGVYRDSLVAIRDRLAAETSDTLWNKHKDQCHCVCGMGDGRTLVALVKELRAVIAELEALPVPEGASRLDGIVANVASLDPHRRRRPPRRPTAEGALGS